MGGFHLAGDQGEVALFCHQVDVAACGQGGDLLADVIFLAGDFLALAVAVGLVSCGGQGEVVLGGQGGGLGEPGGQGASMVAVDG